MAQGNGNAEKKHLVLTPNPFRNTLRVGLANQRSGAISVKIFSADGRMVKVLDTGKNKTSGGWNWLGDDNNGDPVAQGIYFIQVHDQQSNETYNQKVLRVK